MNLPEESSFKNKSLLIVGTGNKRKRFIFQILKKLGLNLIVLNKEKNWANQYTDDWIIADLSDHASVLRKVGEYLRTYSIDGVYNFWENDVTLTAKIAEKFGYIGVPSEVVKNARSKLDFRNFCKKNGLPHPQFWRIHTLADLKKYKDSFVFPVVVKPVWGGGSILVIKADDYSELVSTFEYVASHISPSIDSTFDDGLDIFVEEYIDGHEVDIDIIVQNGKVKFSSVADNYGTAEPFFIETTHSLPSSLTPQEVQSLQSMAEEVLEKLGVLNSCVHFEAKLTEKGPIPIEVNLRMGADETYISNKKVWGFDMIVAGVKLALGEYIKQEHPTEPKCYMMTETLQSKYSGIISSIRINKEDQKSAEVEQFFLDKDVGDTVLVPPQGYDYLGWISVSGKNFPEVKDNLEKAVKTVDIDVIKFESGSVIGKTRRSHPAKAASISHAFIRSTQIKDQRALHIGVACNSFSGEDGAVEADLANVGVNIQKTLEERGYKTTFIDFNNLPLAINQLQQSNIDFVFNVCERINNSSLLEPHAAAILDSFQIPYTGSSPFTLAWCIDKIRVKKLLTYHNIPTAKWDYAFSLDDDIDDELRYPLIVKPGKSDNSIGITNDSVVTNKKDLHRQIKYVIEDLGQPALIEEYIDGDEYDVPILGSEEDDMQVLPLSRTLFDELPQGYWHIYPFESKFLNDEIYDKHLKVQRPPKNVSQKLQKLITEISLDTYSILDCHDYGRVEVKVDSDNNPYVLELNPNPSINIDDCVPAAAELIGMNYGDFIEKIISLALKRYKDRPAYYHLQSGMI